MEQEKIEYLQFVKNYLTFFFLYFRKVKKYKLSKRKQYRLQVANLFNRKRFGKNLITPFIEKTNNLVNDSMQISIKYEKFNIYLNAFFLKKTLAKQNLGYKNRKRRAEKLTFVNNRRAIDDFFAKLVLKLQELNLPQPIKTIIRIRGEPKLKHLKHCIYRVRNIKTIKLVWIEDLNSMIFKSGLREKKPRRL